MTIEELILLAKSKKTDQRSVEAFVKRSEARERKFEEQGRQQAPTEEFLSRSYNM